MALNEHEANDVFVAWVFRVKRSWHCDEVPVIDDSLDRQVRMIVPAYDAFQFCVSEP